MRCSDCGSEKVDHPVVGVCVACYKRRDYIKNKDKHLATKKAYWLRTRDATNAKRRNYGPARKKPEIEHRFTLKARYAELVRKSRINERSFDIGFTLFCELIANPCFYCRGPLAKTGIGLDRKDSSVWYLYDNVVPCCKTCNMVKNNLLTHDEMVVAMGAVVALRKKKLE